MDLDTRPWMMTEDDDNDRWTRKEGCGLSNVSDTTASGWPPPYSLSEYPYPSTTVYVVRNFHNTVWMIHTRAHLARAK